MNESIDVCVISVVRSSDRILSVLIVQGKIIELSDVRCVVADRDKFTVATINLSGCRFDYGDVKDVFGVQDLSRYDDRVILSLDYAGEHSFVTVVSTKSTST